MPRSNEYSMGPEDTRTKSTLVTKPAAKISPFYQERDFRQTKLQEMYGDNPTKRQLRKFNRYASSTQGQADELAFVKDESKKYLDSFSAYGDAALDRIRNANRELALKAKTPVQSTPVTPTPPAVDPIKDGEQKPFNTSFWDGRAKEGGFADAVAVKAWQQQHGSKYGIVADGKFGPKTRAAYEQFKRDYQPLVEEDGTSQPSPVVTTPTTPTTPTAPSADALKRAADTFGNANYFRKSNAWGYDTITIDGKTYQMRVTKGLKDGSGLMNDESYAFDPATGKVRRVAERWSGAPKTSWAEGEDWIDLNGFADEQEWLQSNPKPANRYLLNNANQYYINPKYSTWETNYANNKKTWYKKQGGTMNRINYFQQGGAAPQQDIQQQVVALVQAAMQGDQKATQTVNQIMEAAKAGDQQATQLAQMIQQVAQQMQGQATAAKYGAKLNYLQSLKCGGKTKAKKKEKGGKVCPECEQQNALKKKALISKHQYGGNFYRNWSADDIRALQNKLYGHGYYNGELDGIVGAETIAAVKAYQKAHGLKEDGMWGVNTNSQQKMIDNAIVNKGIYSKDHKTEKGSLATHKGMEYQGKTLKDLSNKEINDAIAYYVSNPEAMYSDDPQHASWRMLLHNSGQQGADILNQVMASMTPEERAKVDAKKRTHQYNSDMVNDQIRETSNRVARVAVPMLAAPVMMGAAVAPMLGVAGLAGSVAGAKGGSWLGSKIGALAGKRKANKVEDGAYVNLESDPVAERYGAVGAAYDPKAYAARGAERGSFIGGLAGGIAGGAVEAGIYNHLGQGRANLMYKGVTQEPHVSVYPYGTTTPQGLKGVSTWELVKAGFKPAQQASGQTRLGGPFGTKFHYKGKVYNAGTPASPEVVQAATTYYNNPSSPLTVRFGQNPNLGYGAKLGNAYDVNLAGASQVGAMAAPASAIAADVDYQMDGDNSRQVRKQKRQERRAERREKREAKKNYFGGWL